MAEKRTHKAIRLEVGDRSADIDLALVGVIAAAWRLGISTEFSCQGQVARGARQPEPWGYIAFCDVADLRKFLECFDGTDLAERRYTTPRFEDPVTGLWEPVHRRRWNVSAGVPPLRADEQPMTTPTSATRSSRLSNCRHPPDADPARSERPQCTHRPRPRRTPMTDPTFAREPAEWLDPDLPGPKNPAALLETYLARYTGGRFEVVAETTTPNAITARDIVAVSMLSVNVPPRAAAWLLDPAGARVVTALLEQIDPAPIWLQASDVITDPEGPLIRLWALLRAPSTQLPHVADENEIGPVIAGKLLAAKRPHLVPIYDRVVARALEAPNGRWWECWRASMSDEILRDRIRRVRATVAAAHPLALALSDLRICDIVIWMAEHGAAQGDLSPSPE